MLIVENLTIRMHIKNNIKYLESYYTEITVGNNKVVFHQQSCFPIVFFSLKYNIYSVYILIIYSRLY